MKKSNAASYCYRWEEFCLKTNHVGCIQDVFSPLATVKPVALIRSIFLARLHDSPETGKDGECFENPTSGSYNHGQKQLRHYLKKTYFVERVSFLISNIHISTPSFLFNVVTTYFN